MDLDLLIKILGLIAQFGLVIIGYLALKQIFIMRQQTELTREVVSINELREFEKVINEFDSFILKIREKKVKFKPIEMKDFDLTESSKEEYKKDMRVWRDLLGNNSDLFLEAQRCANKLEVLSIALVKGTASIEVVQDAIAATFCNMVEHLAYVYVINRNSAINLFKDTIILYKKFKPIVGKNNENLDKFRKEIDRILDSQNFTK